MLPDDPLLTTEFLAVDTETNGLARERCELTEVGAVIVGGGELHDRWSSLVGVSRPLSPGIQRFTGITQAMVDDARPPEQVLPEFAALLRGRVLVAHNARFDVGVLRQAFHRAALDWPDPPVLCTVSLARKLAPLQEKRGLATLAAALGSDVEETHRALPDAVLCGEVFCALFKRLAANAPTVRDAVALLAPRKRAAKPKPPKLPTPVHLRPDLKALTSGPGVYVFRDRDGNPLYVGKSVSVRKRARAHFTEGQAWTRRAAQVDCEPTESELGALLLEGRLIRALKPPVNKRGVKDPDGQVYLTCRLDIAFPILEVSREPVGGHAVCIGPVRGRAVLAELAEQLNSLFGLRHCGRKLPRRYHASAYGQMGRCLSPCLGDLDPNLYRERLEQALRAVDSGLVRHVEAEMRRAAAAQQFERAASLKRRRDRLEVLLGRLGGVLRTVHSGARVVVAPHPAEPGRADVLWVAGGRVVDWGPLHDVRADLRERTVAAMRRAPRALDLGGHLPVDELDEIRSVGAWLASNRFDVSVLELGETGHDVVERFVSGALRRTAA